MIYFVMLSLLIGIAFLAVGTLGVVRFDDVYMRLQAASKSLTFGLIFTILGAGLLSGHYETLAKALVVIVFQFATAPISAHIIARVALRQGLTPAKLQATQRPADPADDEG